VRTNFIVPARRIGITALFILYNADSAQRGNGMQYLNNLLNITCIGRKVLKIHLYLLDLGTCVAFTFSF
jgi:hypothetical protein